MNKTTQITTEQFLEELFGSTEDNIFFNVDRKTWKNKPQTYLQAKPKLKSRNENNDDIYFIPNSGGTKNVQITHINSSFIDWDVGRDTNKKYYHLDIVKQKKQD